MPGKIIGKFYLVSHIGSGGMSQVYLGLNPQTQEKRAVKIVAKRATAKPAEYARFLREIEIIRSLQHPHIVKIMDSGVLPDCYYYMMEYMAGGNLGQIISNGRLAVSQAIPIFSQICEAMAHAHARGIIHRDLKPANVLMNAEGTAMVSDFGIAKALDDIAPSLTRSEEIMGTVAYLAPEQRINTKRVDRRADVYALGVILYEMLMGFPPLGKFPWPSEMQASFPAGLQALLEKCLAFHPDDRFPHAGAILTEIAKHMKDSGIDTGIPATQQQPPESEQPGNGEGPANSDRLEGWLRTLRSGTSQQRLGVVREMVQKLEPREAKVILKLFIGEEDRVRWGLIRVLGDLRIEAAIPAILNELKNPYHRECAIEALGNIGSEEAFNSIREFLRDYPDSAGIALLPLARTGKIKALSDLVPYLSDDMAVIRQAAVKAIAFIDSPESLKILKQHFSIERDEKARVAIQHSIRSLEAALRNRETITESAPACEAKRSAG